MSLALPSWLHGVSLHDLGIVHVQHEYSNIYRLVDAWLHSLYSVQGRVATALIHAGLPIELEQLIQSRIFPSSICSTFSCSALLVNSCCTYSTKAAAANGFPFHTASGFLNHLSCRFTSEAGSVRQ